MRVFSSGQTFCCVVPSCMHYYLFANSILNRAMFLMYIIVPTGGGLLPQPTFPGVSSGRGGGLSAKRGVLAETGISDLQR